MRRNFTKLLSLIMTLCMLVGIMPMWLFVSAAETTESVLLDTAVFASDVHGISADLQNVMSAIGADDIEPSSVNLLGDTMLKMTVAENAIETGLGVDTDVNYVYASKHDDPDTDSDAGDCDIEDDWDFSGPAPNDADYNYHIYIIRESDIAEGSSTYSSAISAFTTWANNITDDKPIFVITHRPLHVRRGENDFAGKWFDAINPVGEDKDVFVLWGHNHYGETSDDRNAYYVAKGDSLNVQYEGNQYSNGVTKNDINFTYMNAGYINANDYTYGNQSVGRRYMATVAFIYNDKIVFQDYFYNKNNTGYLLSGYYYDTTVTSGKYLDYGVKNLSNASYAHNETVELMNKTEIGEPEVSLTKGGIAVSAKGMTTLDVAAVENVAALNDTTKYIGYLAYDVTFDMEEGATATVSLPVPADYKGNLKVFYVDENGELEDMNAEIADGYATFKTTHNSVYALANEVVVADDPVVGDWVTITEPTVGTTTYKYEYTLATNGIETGKDYLIVNTGTNGRAYILTNNNGTATPNEVTISDGKIILTNNTINTNSVWRFASTNSGNVSNGGRNINPGNGSLTLSTTSRSLTINPLGDGEYQLYYVDGSRNVSLRYNNGWTGYRSNRNSTTRYSVYLFELTDSNSTTTDGTPGLYGMVEGDNLTGTIGMIETEAKEFIASEIKVYTANTDTPTESQITEIKYDEGYKITFRAAFDSAPGAVNVAEITRDNSDGDPVVLGTLSLTIPVREVAGYRYVTESGMAVDKVFVNQLAANDTVLKDAEGNKVFIEVTYKDMQEGEQPHMVPFTLSMIPGAITTKFGVYENQQVVYGGSTLDPITLEVLRLTAQDYPEYPNEGAVKVNKTATGINFQSTGVTKVELSASGIPMKKGADLIIMLDTSSSMTKNEVTDSGGKMRSAVLEESLVDLIEFLQTPGDDGEALDIRVAIADFNGYYGDGSGGTSGTPYDRTSGDYVKNGTSNGSGYTQPSEARVYTGSKALDSGAFVNAQDLAASYTLNYTSGTNYDYAFDAIYQLGVAARNSAEEERDLYVIFMSDGASLQWNYFGTQNTYTKWNNWLAGTWDADDLTTTNLNSTTHSYFYDLVDHDGDGQLNEHRMANAIKGDPNKSYEIIRKSTAGLPEGTLTAVEGKQYLYNVPGLGAKLFTINFDAKQDGSITVDSIEKALSSTASEHTGTTQYYYKITKANDLANAFNIIGAEVRYAATNARFVDIMGPKYNLQLKQNFTTIDVNGNSISVSLPMAPTVEVKTYDIWTLQEAEAEKCTYAQVGQRKTNTDGSYIETLLEKVVFSTDGTKAYSNLIDVDKDGIFGYTVNADGSVTVDEGDNIYGTDGVIYAKSFAYNNSAVSVYLDADKNAENGNEYNLTPETFYWNLGTIKSSELAISYYVYLEGSMEGEAHEGSYATNTSAILYYDNHLGNPCQKETVSPQMAWKSASVKYAFYLVNDAGEVIVNQMTGKTGTFANKIAVTQPVLHSEILLNNLTQINSISVASDTVIPEGYTLYDPAATYKIVIKSDSTGSWTITKGTDKVDSTYVTGYSGDKYSNVEHNESSGNDYTNTTVWFAVKWTLGTVPDSVVVDFGLPVDISALQNDLFANNAELHGVGSYDATLLTVTGGGSMDSDFGTALTESSGTAKLYNGKIRYQFTSMSPVTHQFMYAAYYKGESNLGYYYDSVTVIPAANVYYEDSFVKYTDSTAAANGIGVWTQEGETIDKTQTEDRPGFGGLPTYDANKIYGYDPAYDNFTQFSLGSAKKVTVDAATGGYANAPVASFDFTGTGFDIISVTNSDAGLITADIFTYSENGVYDGSNFVKGLSVDNYYGYTYDSQNNKWVVTPTGDTVWQVPVLKFSDLDYGKYHVEIKVMYGKTFDHVADGSYSFWLDAVRIYDPVDTDKDTVAQNAYYQDNELNPDYMTLRDLLVNAGDLDPTGVTNGLVFIDGKAETDSITDYANPGPNNETYLAAGQGVSFKLKANVKPKSVHLGIKLAIGDEATLMYNNTHSYTVKTATDMYYDLGSRLTWTAVDGGYESNTIVLSNATEGAVISITNVKYTSPAQKITAQSLDGDDIEIIDVTLAAFIDEEVVTEAPAMMFRMYRPVETPVEPEIPEVPEEPEVPEVPETFVPEKFETELKAGKKNKDSTIKITTSSDVASITVNGVELEAKAKPGKKDADVKTWVYKVKLAAGTHSFEIVAYDENGIASDITLAELTVEGEKKPAKAPYKAKEEKPAKAKKK